MTNETMDRTFSDALQEVLEKRVQKFSPHRRWLSRRALAIVLPIMLLGGGGGVAAAAILYKPGSQVTTTFGAAQTETHTGPATIHLGARPAGATSMTIGLGCLSEGTVKVVGLSLECAESDVETVAPHGILGGTVLPAGPSTLAVKAPPSMTWRIRITYTRETTTSWAVNARGQTYGQANENGVSDLVAVTGEDFTGHAIEGYIRTSDFPTFFSAAPSPKPGEQTPAAGTPAAVPLYDTIGSNQIGTFDHSQ